MLRNIAIKASIVLLRYLNSSKRRNKIAYFRRSKSEKKLGELVLAIYRAYLNLNFNIQENGEERILMLLSKENPEFVFDVGANVGNWAISFHAMSPFSKIYSFEPIAETFKILQKNTPFAQHYNIGLGKKNEPVRFGKCHESECSSKYSDAIGGLNAFEEIKIEVGDELIKNNGLKKIDFLKIDAEGMDYEVLQGFKNAIERGDIPIIQLEYSKYNIYSRVFLRDYYLFLESHGYRVGKIYPQYVDFRAYNDDDDNFIGSNFLALHKSWIEKHHSTFQNIENKL